MILQIPLSWRRLEDSWAWHHEKNGLLLVRLAYRMLVHTKQSREDRLERRPNCSDVEDSRKEWKTICDLKVPSKIRAFAWRLALNSIPTARLPV